MNIKKTYEYDSILDFCKSGGTADQHLTQLQEDLKAMRNIIRQCQISYHGVGEDSPIYKTYQKVLYHIGSVGGNVPHGLWHNANGVRQLFNMMYYNAEQDKKSDTFQ